MWEGVFKAVAGYLGPGIALILFGVVIGIVYMQRRCKATQEWCQAVRERNKEEVMSKIGEAKNGAKQEIDAHYPACPNTGILTELRTKVDGEIERIHHRITDAEEHAREIKGDVKRELESTRGQINTALTEQQRFLNDLALKLMNGESKGKG